MVFVILELDINDLVTNKFFWIFREDFGIWTPSIVKFVLLNCLINLFWFSLLLLILLSLSTDKELTLFINFLDLLFDVIIDCFIFLSKSLICGLSSNKLNVTFGYCLLFKLSFVFILSLSLKVRFEFPFIFYFIIIF